MLALGDEGLELRDERIILRFRLHLASTAIQLRVKDLVACGHLANDEVRPVEPITLTPSSEPSFAFSFSATGL